MVGTATAAVAPEDGQAMDDTQRAGTRVAWTSAVLWAVFGLWAATDDGGGANIGAGFLGLLALVLGLVAAGLLSSSPRSAGVRAAVALVVAAEVVYLALAVGDHGSRDLVVAVIALIVVALAAAALLTSRSGRTTG